MSCNQNYNQGRTCTCGSRQKIRISASPVLVLLLVVWLAAWIVRGCL